MGVLVLVAGTGTGIGKTHFSEALLLALRDLHGRVIGLKPIETGLAQAYVSDAARLERLSTFHVEPFGYIFPEPLSPHLAAREAGDPIRTDSLVGLIAGARAEADVVVVELAGGLFSPLSDTLVNADFARDIQPDTTLLVAPDRLGALHDVIATLRAAQTVPLIIDGIVLVEPPIRDPATGRNADELARLLGVAVFGPLPRATVAELAAHDAVRSLAGTFSR